MPDENGQRHAVDTRIILHYFFRFGMFRHKFRHFFTLTLYHLTFSFPGHTIFYICVTVHYFHSYICTLHFFAKEDLPLSDFSDLLDHAIARSNLSMLELQEASGIPISYLYKLRKGVRFTKKYTPNVLSLIYALQCPKAEEARLLQEKKLSVVSIPSATSSLPSAPGISGSFRRFLQKPMIFPLLLVSPASWRSMPV